MNQDLAQLAVARLLMPNSFALPPVEYCRGTMPSQAANSRPLRNAAPLPIAATMAVAVTGPMPGIANPRAARIGRGDPLQFVVELFNLLLDCLPLTRQRIDQVTHQRREIRFGVLENVCHRGLQLRRLLLEDQPTFQQKSSDLVDHGRSACDQSVPNPVNRLQVQLVIGLDRNEAHVLAVDSLGDRLRIDKVVLVRLHERLHKLRRNQPNVVPLLAQRSAKKVSPGA